LTYDIFRDYITMGERMKLKSRKSNLGKNRAVLICGTAVLLSVIFFNPAISLAQEAQENAAAVYQDKNNFFTFNPPAGWIKEEVSQDTASEARFTSPDGKVALAIIAGLNEGELNEFFEDKKIYIKDYQKRFPQGKFSLDFDTLGERQVVRIGFQVPRMIKQEQYFFFDQGVRFDLVYGVKDPADFKKYKQTALDAFITVKRMSPVKVR
jgi:hypothetical protein